MGRNASPANHREVADGTGNLIGTVLGSMPCREQDVASDLGKEVKTIRRWRKYLTETGTFKPNGPQSATRLKSRSLKNG